MKSYSLKWRLVAIILAVFLLLWSVVFCWLYFDLEKRLQDTLDERLSASAQMVARLIQQLPINDMDNALAAMARENSTQHLIACEVSLFSSHISTSQQVIARTLGAPEGLSQQKAGFSTWQENGVEWRSYVLQEGQIQVVAAEKLKLRYSLLEQILQAVLIPLIITLIVCVFLILWIIRVEFQPLDSMARQLSLKKQQLSEAATDLFELKQQSIPKEIYPFVDSILVLIQNLQQRLELEKSFSAFAAHELRSPLTAIKTHVQLSQLILQQPQVEQEKVRASLRQAEQSILRYETLLEQLLLLSQTENQQPNKTVVAIPVAPTLKTVVEELSLGYPNLAVRLDIDWAHLGQLALPHATLAIILKNLIENAYVHAQTEQPIHIYYQDNALWICDEGQGLGNDDLALLTQRFWRKSAQQQGHGLGLSLVKLLLEKYGYQLSFSQRLPHGLQVKIYA